MSVASTCSRIVPGKGTSLGAAIGLGIAVAIGIALGLTWAKLVSGAHNATNAEAITRTGWEARPQVPFRLSCKPVNLYILLGTNYDYP
jgi:hypothetical protein